MNPNNPAYHSSRAGSGRCPNDNRSDSKNPNNLAHKAAADNRAKQMNPEHGGRE